MVIPVVASNPKQKNNAEINMGMCKTLSVFYLSGAYCSTSRRDSVTFNYSFPSSYLDPIAFNLQILDKYSPWSEPIEEIYSCRSSFVFFPESLTLISPLWFLNQLPHKIKLARYFEGWVGSLSSGVWGSSGGLHFKFKDPPFILKGLPFI